MRELPLIVRKIKLGALVLRYGNPHLRYSEGFSDGEKLMSECKRRGLEGIVSKIKDAPYRSGTRSGWIKVKCAAWREANRERWAMFEKV